MMSALRTLAARARHHRPIGRFANDTGSMMVDILMAASLLAAASVAALTTIDIAQRDGGNQQAQAVAANLADTEVDRVRSLPKETIFSFSGAQPPRTQIVDGVTYTIRSTGTWANASGGLAGCNFSGTTTSFVLDVTVSWGGEGKNVKLRSVVAPGSRAGSRTTGNLIVRVRDRVGAGQQNVSSAWVYLVHQAGGPGASAARGAYTDASGCVTFANIPTGQWKLEASKANWVTPTSASKHVAEITISQRSEDRHDVYLARAGQLTGRFISQRLRPSPAADVAVNVEKFSIGHASLPESYRGLGAGRANKTRFTTPPLYPYTSAYTVYGGACDEALPPLANRVSRTVTPGVTTDIGDVRLPNLDVKIRDNANVTISLPCDEEIKATADGNGYLPSPQAIPYGESIEYCVVRDPDGLFGFGVPPTTFKKFYPSAVFPASSPVLSFNPLSPGAEVLLVGRWCKDWR